ncbi:Pr6Pr family membrane protein [Streptococcus tangpeifui]|uniref:Pr6Pr family membrane protein n=1 Tax=Streptococcus tangpeifui TaxID=2709400 RepID=UPI0013EBA3CE|nr:MULTISPECIES: Pr6Pr family membrane protein [unclassified Streptococcus]
MSLTQIYRLIFGFCGLIGVSMQIAKDGPGMILYYTVLSNILVFSSHFYHIYLEAKGGSINQHPTLLRIKGSTTLVITLTFLVYHFMLAPKVTPADYWNIRNFLVHYIAPLGMIGDTLIFDRKNIYKALDPLVWTLMPILYCIWALLNGLILKWPIPGSLDSPFPYFFLNVTRKGWDYVLTYILVLAIFYIIIGYILFLTKKILGKKR